MFLVKFNTLHCTKFQIECFPFNKQLVMLNKLIVGREDRLAKIIEDAAARALRMVYET